MGEQLSRKEIVAIKRGMKEAQEGRTYPFRCHHAPPDTSLVCFECVTEACKRWYELGKKDALRKVHP